MAETPNTFRAAPTASAERYRPMSGLAVASAAIACLGAVLILAFTIAARVTAKPLQLPALMLLILLGLPLAGLGLGLLAKLQIRNADGTRAGSGAASVGVWVGLLFGTGYAAYLFATEAAVVRQQARGVADQWFALLAEREPEKAYRLTLAPAQQLSIEENDKEGVRRRFGEQLAVFDRSDLPRLFRSWPADRFVLRYAGVQRWEEKGRGYEAELNYVLRNPEGQFPISVILIGEDDPATGARSWQIGFNTSGIKFSERKFTQLGRYYLDLQYLSTQYLPNWAKQLYSGEIDTRDMIRIDGQEVADKAKRELLEAQLKAPQSLVLFPGGPTRPSGLPTVYLKDDAVELVHAVELRLPALGELVPGMLTVRVTGGAFMEEMRRLAGPDWASQPTVTTGDELEVQKFQPKFKATVVNATPGAPRVGPKLMPLETSPEAPPKP